MKGYDKRRITILKLRRITERHSVTATQIDKM